MPRKNELKAIISCYETHTFFHHVIDGELGPATNLTEENIKTIFKSTIKNAKEKIIFMKFKSLIPENVLHFDVQNNSVIFYTKPAFKKLLFASQLKREPAFYKIPFLLWVYRNKSLSIFALKRKPTSENDILYQAPFMNIYDDGSVCMGNVKYGNEDNYFEDLMDDIVDNFFNSYFSYTNTDKLLTINYNTFLDEQKDNKDFSYAKYLVKTKNKISDIL